ncbi:hypothetical protein WQ54_05430 [Bacillus sp. SA1-12]|uniref:IDEAL domain-containing protein n=1 Tax=Bacillus sp. SA1-12 TaxID=1455638 RepID=UPI0006260B47|nr:IDEAL domain-containing protein [Bacillus sp. SA1-12]KKI93273.1 hypothetical protein WQ54_05430 [Bacillus sp. SA1-12]
MGKFSMNTINQQAQEALQSLHAELILEKAIRDFQMKRIQKEIDKSLQNRNKEEFLKLTKKMKKLQANAETN